ncbi:MAG: alpha/beta fold hydrolase [Candidatus Limivicinus sp.]|jgi:alpha-beta hydrolase superfamily lysophospholipase
MPEITDFYFDSSTDMNRIHARCCVPDGEPRAVLQIAHGISETIDRYEDFMKFLAANGFVVVGNDHLGHGKSISSSYDKGFFASEDGWNYVIKDMMNLQYKTKEKYHGLPYVMFGHSMGSFLTRTFIIKYPDSYDAVILSGTGHQNPVVVNGGYALANLMAKTSGAHSDGQKLNDIAFGSYLSRIENPRTKSDWLSRDNSVVDRYEADPLCGFVCTVGVYRDMMYGIKFVTDRKNIAKMNKEKPVYFMSGAEDPVGEYGKGVERAYKAFCKAGMRDVMIRLYPGGRHEMLNEINKTEVYQDILNWLNEKLF